MKKRPRIRTACRPVKLGSHSGSLRLVAFSDYRVQDIDLLIEELLKLQPRADLILYGGDDIRRFRPSAEKNLFEGIARCSRYGLCAVIGNDDPEIKLLSGNRVINVHIAPAILGDWAVLGVEGAPSPPGFVLHSEREISRHLVLQKRLAGQRKLIILSHAPPAGTLDKAIRFSPDKKPRSIGSRALKTFVRANNRVVLVACGHVHRCGGRHEKLNRAMVVNAACHDDFGAIGRFAIVDIEPGRKVQVEWREIHEISSIPGIGPTTRARLGQIGIRTVHELADRPLEDLIRIPALPRRAEVLRARARAHVEMRPVLIRPLDLPRKPEIFLDLETDLNGGSNNVWLIGLAFGRNGAYQGFFADTPADEHKMLTEFLAVVASQSDAIFLTFSGSRFEERVLRARLLAHNLEASLCERVLDLSSLFWRSVALPIESEELKDVGKILGYKYRHSDMRGDVIAALYEQEYVRSRSARRRQELKHKFLSYNEDDVRCLPFILDAIEKLPLASEVQSSVPMLRPEEPG